jgi:hypothetical protein
MNIIMDVRLTFLNTFFSELDAAGVWYVVLRNHEEIYTGTEKDIDMLCSPSNFKLTHTIFCKVCSENGHICNWDVSGKSLGLSTEATAFDRDSNTFSRGLHLHFVGFASVRDSYLKVKIPGYSLKFRNDQIQRVKMAKDRLTFWMPSTDWQILFLLEKMQYKRKIGYKDKIVSLLLDTSSKIGTNRSLRSLIHNSLKEDSTTSERLLVVQKSLKEINYSSNFVKVAKEWLWLGKENLSALVKKKGLIITFSGPDGAGKSTTKSHLINFLQDDVGLTVNSIKGFNRLNEPKLMGSLITKVQYNVRGVNKKSPAELETNFRDRKPKKRAKFSWKFRRLLGLLFIVVQYPIFYSVARIRTYYGVTTVVDTSVFDRFVKAHRPRFRTLERVFTPILPAGDITFRLYAPPNVIADRKPELTIIELEEYYGAMDDIFSLKHSSRIKTIETHLESKIAAKKVKNHVMNALGFCKI